MTTGSVQRIYIGGIDPQRLTIDDISSRLRRLVDVVSIEAPANKPSDDCFVHTGPSFFYLNARCPSAEEDDTAESTATPAKASPLQVLSKAYNNVKWKGCTLRVEEARPHFLDRLRLEREERERKERQEMEERHQSKDTETSDDENEVTTEEAAPSVANLPRNLRIRRRHGEEAFSVDTKPIDVGSTTVDDTNAHDGNKWKSRTASNHAKRSASETQWENFGTALDKLRRKRAKHADQYAEQKRRLKRQAKGRGPKGGVDADSMEDVGTLNGKVFLNRAVHVRFAEDTENDDAFKVDATPWSKRKDENKSNNSRDEVIAEESAIGDESSVASSDSDSSEDEDDVGDTKAKKDYAWSDDDDDDDDDESSADEANEGLAGQTSPDEDNSSSDSDTDGPSTKAAMDTKEEEKTKAAPTTGGYAWSDDDFSDDDSSDDEAKHHSFGGPRDMGRSFSSLKPVDYDKPDGCKECSKPTDYDEFSSAVDFTGGGILNEGQIGEEDDAPIINNDGGEDYQLDNDVSANLNVLGQLFPDMARIKPNQPSAPDEDGEASAEADGFTPQVSRPGWGVTGLMQRYDPNDSKSAKFEVEVSATKGEGKVKGVTSEKSSGEDSDGNSGLGSDAEKEEEADRPNELSAYASTSSEDSDDDSEDDGVSMKEGDNKGSFVDDQMEVDKEMTVEDHDVDDKKEIYEQDKLEGIFQEARTGGASGGFQMSQLFGDLGNAQQNQATSSTKEPGSSAGFSFGFNVGGGDGGKAEDPSAQTGAIGDKPASGFSFSFNMPGTDEQGSDTKDTVEAGRDQVDVSTEMLHAPPNKESEVTLKRRRGLLFPEDVLDELEQSFFHMNEGKQILEDYEAMKADPESQSAWQEERKTLTLDWKRKQKFALSRKQKRRK